MKTTALKHIFLFITLVTFGFIGQASAQTASDTTKAKPVKTVTLTVTGMGCVKDNKIVEDALYEKKGVKSVDIDGEIIKIKYDERKVKKEELIAAIEACGTCEDKSARPHKVTGK